MKRQLFFLMLCIWFQFTRCNEYRSQDSVPINKTATDAVISPLKRLKSIITRQCSYTYFYDSRGRLLRMLVNPSSGSSAPVIETYTYNRNGRIIKSASQVYTQLYKYDLNNQLTQHTRIDRYGKRDSVMFVYAGDTTVGRWKNITYYYTNNCLNKIYDSDHLCHQCEARGIVSSYTYNSNEDLAYTSLLKNYDVLTLADFGATTGWYYGAKEIINQNRHAGNCCVMPVRFERTYDKGKYPVKLKILAASGYTVEPDREYRYY